jgi:sec-independent protein translocase protein TatB
MFGIGTFEFLVIILVAVLVLGPEQLPRVVRTVTRVMSDFRRISTDFQRAVNLQVNQEEYREKHGDKAFQAANKALGPKKKKKKKKPAPEEGEEASLAAAQKPKRKKKTTAVSTAPQDGTEQGATASGSANTGTAAAYTAGLTAGEDASATTDEPVPAPVDGSPAESAADAPVSTPSEDVPGHTETVASQTEAAPASTTEDEEAADERFRQVREALRSKGIDPDAIPTQGGRA